MTEVGYRQEMPAAPPGLRVGARVRCLEGDPFIDPGTEGIVTNTVPPRPHAPARARVLWVTDCVCIIDATFIEVIA